MLPVPNSQHPGRPLQVPKKPRKDSGVGTRVGIGILRTVHHTSFFRPVIPLPLPQLSSLFWSTFPPPTSTFHLISLLQAKSKPTRAFLSTGMVLLHFAAHKIRDVSGQLSKWQLINSGNPRLSSPMPSGFSGNIFPWGTSMQDPAFCPPWSLPSNTVILLTLRLRQQVKQGKPGPTVSATAMRRQFPPFLSTLHGFHLQKKNKRERKKKSRVK